MPWTQRDYPDSMKNLPAPVRSKAIDIGNALLDEGDMEEGIAIATAISRAKDWAANRGKETESRKPGSRSTDVKSHGNDWYVVPYGKNQWAIKNEGASRVQKVFDNKKLAVKQGRERARRSNASLTIQKRDGKLQQRVSYNPNKRARKQQ